MRPLDTEMLQLQTTERRKSWILTSPFIEALYSMVGTNRVSLWGCGVIVVFFCGCNPNTKSLLSDAQKSASEVQHSTTVRESGFNFSTQTLQASAAYSNGEMAGYFSILESIGGGLALVDFDQDGDLDLVLAGGGSLEAGSVTAKNCKLLRNVETKHSQMVFDELSVLPAASHFNHGVSVADVDNDGFQDLLISGFGNVQLLRNMGDGQFQDATVSSNLNDQSWSTSTAWGDLDNDGFVDLYVAHYVNWNWENNPSCLSPIQGQRDVCSPNEFKPLDDMIFFNNGDWTFTKKASPERGLVVGGKGLGVVIADLNDDKRLDIYVANDTTNNFLYLGQGNGVFQESGMTSGVALDGNGAPNGSMGIALFDFNKDLKPDLWVTNFENETIAAYQNAGNGVFGWASDRLGLGAIGRSFVSFGTVAGDFDCDGDEDVVVANGHVMQFPANSSLLQVPLLFAASTTSRMVRVTVDEKSYFATKHRGRGVVTGDLDADGDLDLVFTHTNEPPAVLLNQQKTTSKFLTLRLIGTSDSRDPIGAQATLKTSKADYRRWITGGGSYLSQCPYDVQWVLASDEVPVSLTIDWLNGPPQVIKEFGPRPMKVVQPIL
jgi:enediyne biosynthesis protein E4